MKNNISLTINVNGCDDQHHRRPQKERGELWLSLVSNFIIIKGKIMAVSLTSTQFVDGVLQPVDSKGRSAKVQAGSVVFASTDPSIFTIVTDPTNELAIRIV